MTDRDKIIEVLQKVDKYNYCLPSEIEAFANELLPLPSDDKQEEVSHWNQPIATCNNCKHNVKNECNILSKPVNYNMSCNFFESPSKESSEQERTEEVKLLNEIISNQHKLMTNAEKRGYDKAMEEFASQSNKVTDEEIEKWAERFEFADYTSFWDAFTDGAKRYRDWFKSHNTEEGK